MRRPASSILPSDGSQQIVEIVRDPARQLPDHFQLLGLAEAFLHLPALRHVPDRAGQPDGTALLVPIETAFGDNPARLVIEPRQPGLRDGIFRVCSAWSNAASNAAWSSGSNLSSTALAPSLPTAARPIREDAVPSCRCPATILGRDPGSRSASGLLRAPSSGSLGQRSGGRSLPAAVGSARAPVLRGGSRPVLVRRRYLAASYWRRRARNAACTVLTSVTV